jgi:hypothetical protein
MNDQNNIQREVLSLPAQPRTGLILYDAKDPEKKYQPITPVRPPAGAPNALLVLIDDAGFGSSGAFGGPCHQEHRQEPRCVCLWRWKTLVKKHG